MTSRSSDLCHPTFWLSVSLMVCAAHSNSLTGQGCISTSNRPCRRLWERGYSPRWSPSCWASRWLRRDPPRFVKHGQPHKGSENCRQADSRHRHPGAQHRHGGRDRGFCASIPARDRRPARARRCRRSANCVLVQQERTEDGVNKLATALWYCLNPKAAAQRWRDGDVLRGPVIITGGLTPRGKSKPVPAWAVSLWQDYRDAVVKW